MKWTYSVDKGPVMQGGQAASAQQAEASRQREEQLQQALAEARSEAAAAQQQAARLQHDNAALQAERDQLQQDVANKASMLSRHSAVAASAGAPADEVKALHTVTGFHLHRQLSHQTEPPAGPGSCNAFSTWTFVDSGMTYATTSAF